MMIVVPTLTMGEKAATRQVGSLNTRPSGDSPAGVKPAALFLSAEQMVSCFHSIAA
jgi:hypothetical protein